MHLETSVFHNLAQIFLFEYQFLACNVDPCIQVANIC